MTRLSCQVKTRTRRWRMIWMDLLLMTKTWMPHYQKMNLVLETWERLTVTKKMSISKATTPRRPWHISVQVGAGEKCEYSTVRMKEVTKKSQLSTIKNAKRQQRNSISSRTMKWKIWNLPYFLRRSLPTSIQNQIKADPLEIRRLFPNAAFIPSGRILIFFQHRLRSPTRTPNLTPIAQ